MRKPVVKKNNDTSWEKVKPWYDQAVGQEGHYYHQEVILPKLMAHWNLDKCKSPAILDLACGQGVLARHIPSSIPYTGVDISPSLIKAAESYDKNPKHHYHVSDITKPLKVEGAFTHASIILALQNLEFPDRAIKNAAKYLVENGTFSMVINHPYFRIPRQTSWGIDEPKKLQYRRIDRYLSPLKIPIQAHPGKFKNTVETLSYHWPLESLTVWLKDAGFVINEIQEWCSNKTSTGSKAKMENSARKEFPLFMHISAQKIVTKS